MRAMRQLCMFKIKRQKNPNGLTSSSSLSPSNSICQGRWKEGLGGGSTRWVPECEISVSKLLSFETCPFFVWYRYRYRFWKILVSKKVLVSVSEKVSVSVSKSLCIGINFENQHDRAHSAHRSLHLCITSTKSMGVFTSLGL